MTRQAQLQNLVLIALVLFPYTVAAQSPSGDLTVVQYDIKGSAPPVKESYACTRSLRGKFYNRKEADACLQTILSHPQFAAGKVVAEHHRKYTEATFILESPKLTLSSVDLGLPEYLQSPGIFKEFVSEMKLEFLGHFLFNVYDFYSEGDTRTELEQFLASTGQAAIVSTNLTLDYEHKTADLRYTIWNGPAVPAEIPLRPGPSRCKVYVGNVNEINLDGNTPLPLLQKTLGLRGTPCFLGDEIKQAEQELRATGIFSSLQIDISGSEEWRDVTVTARTVPTNVKHVSCKFYGALADAETCPLLPLTENKPYRTLILSCWK